MIRKMEERDIRAVQQVAAESWHDTYEGIIPREVRDRFLAAAYSPASLKRRMEQSVLLVAEDGDGIAGFVNLYRHPESDDGELSAIYLLPSHQGRGLGTSLLESGIAELKDAERLYLTVERDNEKGRRFYERHGFSIADEFEEEFGGHTLSSIRMMRPL
ncbi:Ribosomal protein S18 acetylase RimI [Bhargavaea ginsengi]|uniref:Ribosomal protein S18 acetylase RimI n=1 Tax=Bhargavaea ginsengi TaxID=426757 RepID=A0A1H7BTJ4_9BACL|nr:GNAT family N-acetyltransferase [Bhargavaea ginsengi]MCM3088811.1 GNAT family N-acetyltransferase [Bhargavaea ginsengi]SEJ80758.1 Ribosomal protein S18 acetylase RimI [Bhargavaea ginsengi]